MSNSVLTSLDVEAIRIPNGLIALELALENEGRDKSGGIKGLSTARSDVFTLALPDIYVKSGWNSRDFSDAENQEHVLELAASIAEIGVKEPLTGYYEDGKFWLINGECRYRAAWHAVNNMGSRIAFHVPIRTRPKENTDADDLAYQFVGNSGKPLKPLEAAHAAKRLIDAGWDVSRIHSVTGKSEVRIRQWLSLLQMPQEVQEQVTSGVVSATLAAEVVREHGEGAADAIQQAASANGGAKTGRATRKALESVSGGAAQRTPRSQMNDNERVLSLSGGELDDLSSDLEKALVENQSLREQVEQLSASDSGRLVAGLQAQVSALTSRNQTLTQEVADLRNAAKYKDATLERLRKLLNVDANGELEGAIRDLKG